MNCERQLHWVNILTEKTVRNTIFNWKILEEAEISYINHILFCLRQMELKFLWNNKESKRALDCI